MKITIGLWSTSGLLTWAHVWNKYTTGDDWDLLNHTSGPMINREERKVFWGKASGWVLDFVAQIHTTFLNGQTNWQSIYPLPKYIWSGKKTWQSLMSAIKETKGMTALLHTEQSDPAGSVTIQYMLSLQGSQTTWPRYSFCIVRTHVSLYPSFLSG